MTVQVIPYEQIDRAAWNALVADTPCGWWWQTTHWIDYLACLPDHVNLSFAVAGAHGYELVVPFFYSQGQIQAEGEPCPSPVGADAPDVLDAMASQMEASWSVYRWPVERIRHGRTHQDRHGDLTLDQGWRDISWPTRVVTLPASWGEVRKSYRPLIARAVRERGVRVGAAPSLIAEYHQLHAAARGRESRPPENWRQIAAWAAAGHVLVVLVGTPAVAGGYFLLYKGMAYYASGSSLEANCQHAAIWCALEALSIQPVRAVELGWCARPWDTVKQQQIAFFKAGFGGQEWWVTATEGAVPA